MGSHSAHPAGAAPEQIGRSIHGKNGSSEASQTCTGEAGAKVAILGRNEERGLVYNHHHARFDVDEAAMAIGVETTTRAVLRYFNG